MKTSFRRILYIVLALLIVAAISTIAAEFFIKHKIEELVAEQLPENMAGNYDDITVNLWTGSIFLENPSLIIKNEKNNINHTFINLESVKVSDLSFWKYLTKNELHIGKIVLKSSQTIVHKDRKEPVNDSVVKPKSKIELPPIHLDLFKLEAAEFAVYDNEKDSTNFKLKNLSVTVRGVELNNETLRNKIPFTHQTIEASSDSIFLKVNAYENLTLESFVLSDGKNVVFKNLDFTTKYSKTGLSQLIDVERDHYNLSLESLSIEGYDFGFTRDTFYAKSRKVILDAPSLAIFRDKLITDDTSTKPLYSRSLRELPIQLSVDSLQIRDGTVNYQERVQEENQGGSINFKDMEALVTNLGNTYKEKTTLSLQTVFMDHTPFSAVWRFDVQNINDDFLFEGKVGHLEAKNMNTFTAPNMNVRLEGQANQTYFTIDGNNDTSQTTMKISYSDFRVNLLRSDGEKKNKVISALVNIFVSKNSEKKNELYREVSAPATRDKTKSVFNFLWISVRNALQKILT